MNPFDIDNRLVTTDKDPENLFHLLEEVGKGTYGSVYKAQHKETGNLLAIKIVEIKGSVEPYINETRILKELNSPYIIKYYGCFQKEKKLWIGTEFCEFGSLLDIMAFSEEKLSEEFVASVTQMVLIALVYMHAKDIIHRDIKAANILIDVNGNVKIADFGISAEVDDEDPKRYSKLGSPYWMSPEVVSKAGHDQATDIWSLGITCIELSEGNPPNSQYKPTKALSMIENDPPVGFEKPEKFSKDFNDFVSLCLSYLPEKRPSAQALLAHNFILKNSRGSSFIKDEVNKIMNENCSSHDDSSFTKLSGLTLTNKLAEEPSSVQISRKESHKPPTPSNKGEITNPNVNYNLDMGTVHIVDEPDDINDDTYIPSDEETHPSIELNKRSHEPHFMKLIDESTLGDNVPVRRKNNGNIKPNSTVNFNNSLNSKHTHCDSMITIKQTNSKQLLRQPTEIFIQSHKMDREQFNQMLGDKSFNSYNKEQLALMLTDAVTIRGETTQRINERINKLKLAINFLNQNPQVTNLKQLSVSSFML